MSTAHVYSVNFFYVDLLKSLKNASSVPKDSNGKRPALPRPGGGEVITALINTPYTCIVIQVE